MPISNVTLGTNTISIQQAGDYEVNYMLLVGTVLIAVGLSAGVRINDATNFIPSTYQTRLLSIATDSFYEGSTIVSLATGDVLDLAVQSTLAVNATLGAGLSAYLTVKKLSA